MCYNRNWRETRQGRKRRRDHEAEAVDKSEESEEKPDVKRPHPNGHPHHKRSPKKAKGARGNSAPAGMLIKIPVVEMKGINGEEANKASIL